MQKYIDKYLNQKHLKISNSKKNRIDYIDLDSFIAECFNTNDWNENNEKLVECISKKIEISKKLYSKYNLNWTKHQNTKVASSFQSSLVTFLFYVSYKNLLELKSPVEKLFKRMNAIFILLDFSKEAWTSENSKLQIDIEKDFKKLIKRVPLKIDVTFERLAFDFKKNSPKIVPITILYYDGPIARAYLGIFKSLNIKPIKIIEIVSSIDISTKKKIGTFLPKKLKVNYARFSQETKINYWPRYIQNNHKELQKEIFDEINQKFDISKDLLHSTTKKINLSHYSDNVETIFVEGLKDKELEIYLQKNVKTNILFTGGGLVPKSLLSFQNIKFIHFHPGYLPIVKGADCTLWSSLIYGRTAATCFFMSEGIDTGDIIMSKWMPELKFYINSIFNNKTLYRAVYSFIDPWVRATLLREFLVFYMINSNSLITKKQNINDGYTFHFMHKRIKKSALELILINQK